jgi:hypothetical protein
MEEGEAEFMYRVAFPAAEASTARPPPRPPPGAPAPSGCSCAIDHDKNRSTDCDFPTFLFIESSVLIMMIGCSHNIYIA